MTVVETSQFANYNDTRIEFDKYIKNAGFECECGFIVKRVKHLFKKCTIVDMGKVFIEDDYVIHHEKTILITSTCEEMTSAMMGLEDFLAPLERKVIITEEFTRKV